MKLNKDKLHIKDINVADEIIKRTKEEFKNTNIVPRKIIVFGSWAKGKAVPNKSDIDIIIFAPVPNIESQDTIDYHHELDLILERLRDVLDVKPFKGVDVFIKGKFQEKQTDNIRLNTGWGPDLGNYLFSIADECVYPKIEPDKPWIPIGYDIMNKEYIFCVSKAQGYKLVFKDKNEYERG